VNVAVSATILIGALGGFFLLSIFKALEAPLLALVSGAFLFVVLNDLIPHAFRTSSTVVLRAIHLSSFIVGALLMLSVVAFTPHVHGDGSHDTHHHEEGGALHEAHDEDDH
jgi:zinc transporter ZupT